MNSFKFGLLTTEDSSSSTTLVVQWLSEAAMTLQKRFQATPKMTLLQGLARSKPLIRLLMGLCLGVALSLMVAPFVEDQCASLYAQSQSSIKKNDGYDHDEKDDFEPVIKTIPPTKEDFDGRQEQGGKQARIVRPRYLSTELGIKEKLFISVLTDARSIETRGVAVNKTLNHLVQKVTFFMNGHASALPQGLPIVSFSNNRSHMVPFHTIKYIADHYLNAYDWFYFFADSTYVRGDSLTEFVQHVSVAQNLMIGKPTDTENDRISTCDLGAGVLLSQVFLEASHVLYSDLLILDGPFLACLNGLSCRVCMNHK